MKTETSMEHFRKIPLAEQEEINGGAFPFFILIGAAAVTQIILDWDNFKNGLLGRPEEKSTNTIIPES